MDTIAYCTGTVPVLIFKCFLYRYNWYNQLFQNAHRSTGMFPDSCASNVLLTDQKGVTFTGTISTPTPMSTLVLSQLLPDMCVVTTSDDSVSLSHTNHRLLHLRFAGNNSY